MRPAEMTTTERGSASAGQTDGPPIAGKISVRPFREVLGPITYLEKRWFFVLLETDDEKPPQILARCTVEDEARRIAAALRFFEEVDTDTVVSYAEQFCLEAKTVILRGDREAEGEG